MVEILIGDIMIMTSDGRRAYTQKTCGAVSRAAQHQSLWRCVGHTYCLLITFPATNMEVDKIGQV